MNGQIRYIKQRKDSSDCGPIAIINACKYYGVNLRHKEIPLIRMLCASKKAVPVDRLDKTIRVMGDLFRFTVKRKLSPPKLHEFREYIKKDGNAAILCYLVQRLPGDYYLAHYILCIGYEDNKFIVVNDEESQTVSYLTNVEMNSYLKFGSKKHKLPDIWFLKKKKMK